jgi:hypothetical protein
VWVRDNRSRAVDPGDHARRDRWFAFADYCARVDESAKRGSLVGNRGNNRRLCAKLGGSDDDN